MHRPCTGHAGPLPSTTTDALREAAQKLTAAQLATEPLAEGAAFVFAVSHHARGCEKELVGELLGRGESIKAVAAGVEAACAAAGVASKVSLSAPAWALCMEVVPVACGANGKKVSPVALMTLLPQRLLVTKPRLGIRSLREAA